MSPAAPSEGAGLAWRARVLRQVFLVVAWSIPPILALEVWLLRPSPAWMALLGVLWLVALLGQPLLRSPRWVEPLGALFVAVGVAFLVSQTYQGRSPSPGSTVGLAGVATLAGVFLGGPALALTLAAEVGLLLAAHLLAQRGLLPRHELAGAPERNGWWGIHLLELVVLWSLLAISVSAVLRRSRHAAVLLQGEVRTLLARQAELEAAEEARVAAGEAARRVQDLELLGRLTAGLAHDFNNSLAVIMSWAGAMQDPQVSEADRAEASEAIASSAERAAAVARRLSAVGHREAGVRERIDLGALAGELVRSGRWLLPAGFRLAARRADEAAVVGVGAQLEQVLLNFVLNARDALPAGGEILLETGPATAAEAAGLPAGRFMAARVRDAGTGMDEATRARLFEPFFTTKGAGVGLGLGLSSARAIAEEHGGRIHVESRLGAGSTFSLVLPAAPAGEVARPASMAGPVGRSGRRLLLVEDDGLVRRAMARVLRAGGLQVIEAGSGDAGVAACALGGLDLLCVDAILPDLPSQRVADAFLAHHPGRPVLVCSGLVEEEALRARIAVGEYAFLAKPFDGASLVARVAALLTPEPPA